VSAARPGHAFGFAGARVRDAMRAPIISCGPDLPLGRVAQLMVGARIHCVAVVDAPRTEGAEGRFRGLLSDLGLISAADAGEDGPATAGELAGAHLASVGIDAPLLEAAEVMRQERTHHLVVVDDGRPVGVVSTIDLARALAWDQPPAPPD
jgi:CBS domain-containing protein